MRVATMLLCLALAACAGAGGKLPGEQPVPEAAIAPAATVAPTPAPAPAPAPANAPAAGARSTARPAPAPSPAAAQGPDVLTQARVDCWMKVEHQKGLRDIDRRIAFVDKCVADAMKAQAR